MLNGIETLFLVAIVLVVQLSATTNNSFIDDVLKNTSAIEDRNTSVSPSIGSSHLKIPPPGPNCEIKRSCDPSMYEKGCDTSKRKFIIFGNDGSGIGNQLVFFPSVYAIAIGQGRLEIRNGK